MKLITEANAPNFEAITSGILYEETTDDNGNNVKTPYIEGIFIQADKPNRNGRVYPRRLMEGCVQSYMQDRFPNEKTSNYRTYGELGHPEGVEINLHRVSHIITDLRWELNNVMGKAKLVDTEYGRIAQSLLNAGGQLGVSSRGVGSLDESPTMQGQPKMVTEYELIAVDIVADPSAPDGFVQGILESVEFVCVGGKYTESSLKRSTTAYDKLKESLEQLPKKERNTYLNQCVKEFLDNL
jgi:hypothetical protein